MIALEEIEKLASLSRITLSEEEKKRFQKEIESILEYVGEIKTLTETDSGEKKTGEVYNVFREDGEPHEPGMYSRDLLSNAPQKDGEYFKVKKIL